MSEGNQPEGGEKQAASNAQPASPKVRWDDSAMNTAYANVVNAASTREEVTLFFGTNQTWNVADAKEVVVRLSDRIVLSPFAAKRLWVLLGSVLNEHEKRYGRLELDARQTAGSPGGNS
jgi:hypothetical protein